MNYEKIKRAYKVLREDVPRGEDLMIWCPYCWVTHPPVPEDCPLIELLEKEDINDLRS